MTQMEILRRENAPRRVRVEVWHDTGADHRGNDPHFRLVPKSPASPAVPQRPEYGQQFRSLGKVFEAELTVRAIECDRADFFYRLLNNPHDREFTYSTAAEARAVGRAYQETGLRPPRWGDVIVLDWPDQPFGPGARLIHACWPVTDDPGFPRN